MSLLKKASIITTPTAYAEDYLYSIKPAIPFGEELVINGNFHNNVDSWSNGNSGVNTWVNGHLVCTGDGGSYAAARQVIPAVENRKYIVTAQIARVSGSFQVGIEVNDGNGSGWNVIGSKTTSSEFVTVSEVITTNTGTTQLDLRATIFNTTVDNTNSLKLDNVSVKLLTDADFDFDRNSTGTRVNEDYLIEDVPYNLVSYSEDLSQFTKVNATVTTNQTLAPNGTLTADKIVFNGTANARVEQNLSATIINTNYSAGAVNTQSVFLKTESGTANIDIGLAGHDTTTVIVTSEWKRFTHTGTGTFPRMKSDSAVTIFAWGVQVVAGSKPKEYLKTTDRLDIPRIDYTNGEPSILLEPQRTNSYQYSNDVTQSFWLNMGILIDTSNLYLSPEGINNAQKITANVGSFRLLRPNTNISGTGYAVSVFVKNINALNFYLRTATGFSYYNFETKTVNLAGSDNLTAIHYPNDWVRLITTTPNASYKQFGFGQSETDSNDIGNSVYIYGAQLEAGSYATSLIHTSGSAVTRSADAANNAGNSDLFNDSEGVLYAEIKALANESSVRQLAISDGTANEAVKILYLNSTQIRIELKTASGTDFVKDVTLTTNEFQKIALQYKASNYKVFLNGEAQSVTQTSAVASGLDRFNFDRGDGADDWYGNVKSVMIFKEALTDLELACLTGYNNHELYMNYYNRLSYLGLVEEYNVESDINNYIL